MWSLFIIDVLFAVLIAFVPGYLLLRAFNFSPVASLANAPVMFGIFSYGLAFVYLSVGVASSWYLIVLPFLLGFLALFVSRKFYEKRKNIQSKKSKALSNKTVLIYFAYIGVAVLVGLFVLVKSLDGASSFAQQYDNYAHLSMVRQFIDSGVYALTDVLSYPAAWHNFVAIVSDFGSMELTVAVNAVNFSIASVIFPTSMFFFLLTVFKGDKLTLLCGSICAVAFTAFPWGLIAFGPLYPNLLSYAILPAIMGAFMYALTGKASSEKISYFLLFVLGCLFLVLAHPNAIFAGIVLMVPFVVSQIWNSHFRTRSLSSNRNKILKVLLIACFLAIVLVAWSVFFNASAFQSVVSFNWPRYLSKPEALANAILVSWTPHSVPQLFLAALIFSGAISCIANRKNIWLVVSYVIALIILVTVQSSEGFLKHFLGGFWYTDKFRIAAMAAIAAIPIASVGLSSLLSFVVALFKDLHVEQRKRSLYVGSLIFISVVMIYFPNYCISQYQKEYAVTPFGNMANIIEENNSLSESAVYTQSEVNFVNKVKDYIEDDAYVANVPFDGSFLSYGVNGINTSYRALETAGYWDGVSDPEGRLIRANLCNYSSDQDTYDIVKKSGIKYVLLLDANDTTGESMYNCAKDLSFWAGILNINDDTPGFEIVLAEGDMRLYRLTNI